MNCAIRECGSTLYVGMAQGVSFSLYIGIGAKIKNTPKTGKRGYVQLNIERSYYKLTLKVSEHIPLRNNRASKIPFFVSFSSSSSPAVTQKRRGLLERF